MTCIWSSKFTTRRLAALVLFTLLASACGQESTVPMAPTPPGGKPAETAESEPLRRLHLRSPDNEIMVSFRWNSEEVQVLFSEEKQQRFLRSRLGQTRQRRYHERGVGPVALVRTAADGKAFNILSIEEELWWRVRLGKKMALLDDSTLQPWIQLRRPKAGIVQARLEKEHSELGRAVVRKKRVRVFDAAGVLTHKAGRRAPDSLLYSLVNVTEVDTMTRYILMAELLVRNM